MLLREWGQTFLRPMALWYSRGWTSTGFQDFHPIRRMTSCERFPVKNFPEIQRGLIMDVHLLLEHSEAQSIQLYANHHECKSPSGVLGHWIFSFPTQTQAIHGYFPFPRRALKPKKFQHLRWWRTDMFFGFFWKRPYPWRSCRVGCIMFVWYVWSIRHIVVVQNNST